MRADSSDTDQVSLSTLEQIERVCTRFENAWRAGDRPRIEAYLTGSPGADAPLLFRELLRLELDLRRETREPFDSREYGQRFPQFVELIDTAFGEPPSRSITLVESAEETLHLPGFELLEEIGRGGMGVVYKAREISLKRLVAVKLISTSSAHDHEERARFRREAESSARMQHPHIVQIHAVGEHEGRPYLVLEYVDGGNLADRLGGKPQPAASAAQLVETLACAIQFAHDHDIVHRDLKPANILLRAELNVRSAESKIGDTQISGPSTQHFVPKITDFGLAKQLDDESLQTRTGLIVGTPSYMAPEQASADSRHVGPCTDIHALGAILYEMLTGRPPFQGPTVLETLEQVRSQEPVPPRRLQPGVPRDLETICLQCLLKEPPKRYGSAQALADDLARFRRGEPIVARSLSAWERTLKWARRRPAAAGLIGVATLLLVVLLVAVPVLAWFNRELQTSNRQLEQARERRERYFAKALAAVDSMLSEVGSVDLNRLPQLTPVRERILKRALTLYQEFLAERSDDPKVRSETGRAYWRIGDIQDLLGNHDEAATAYQEAIDLFQALVDELPTEPRYRHDLAQNYVNRADLQHNRRRMPEAEASYQRAIDLLEPLSRQHPDTLDYQHHLATCYNNLSNIYQDTGRLPDAEAALQKALALRRALGLRPAGSVLNPDTIPENRLSTAMSQYNRANVFRDTGRSREAEIAYQQALATLVLLTQDYPHVRECHFHLARCYHNLGLLYARTNRFEPAALLYQKEKEVLESLIQKEPEALPYQQSLGEAHNHIGCLHHNAGRWPEAEAALQQALKLFKALTEKEPLAPDHQKNLAGCYVNLGNVHLATRRYSQANDAYRQAFPILEQLTQTFPRELTYQEYLGACYFSLGRLAYRQARPQEGETALKSALRVNERLARNHPDVPRYRHKQAMCHMEWGEWDGINQRIEPAKLNYQKAIAVLESLAPEYPRQAEYRNDLARGYNQLGIFHEGGHPAEAEAAYRRARSLWEELMQQHPQVADYAVSFGGACCNLGNVCQGPGRSEDALACYARAIQTLQGVLEKQDHATARQFLRHSFGGRVKVWTRLGRHEQALSDWDQLIALEPRNLTLQVERTVTLARLQQHEQASAEAAKLVGTKNAPSSTLLNLARVYALATAAAERDEQLPAPERAEYAERYARQAVELLQQAVRAGAAAEPLQRDSDFSSLHGRPAFQKLLQTPES